MFENISLAFVLAPVLLLTFIAFLISRSSRFRKPDLLKQALRQFEIFTFGYGLILLILCVSLADTATISTFGYPKDPEDIRTPELLLNYLQDYNRVIARTREVVFWLVFFTPIWFLSSLITFSEVLIDSLRKERKGEGEQGVTTAVDA